MAIQTINDALPNGDSPRKINEKINANFTDQTNAASRLVGTERGQVPVIGSNFYEHLRQSSVILTAANLPDLNALKGLTGKVSFSAANTVPDRPSADSWEIEEFSRGYGGTTWAYGARQGGKIWVRGWSTMSNDKNYSDWGYIYTSGNTKLDTNGAVSPSSPTIDLYSDRIETNGDGSRMNPEFVRNGVGDYTIKNTTGLRDDGWYIKIPNDMNGNPKVAVAIDIDKDGNLSVKTYKRTFSMETFTFGPDLSEPLDIPEGRWIDLRFNDLPEEELEEPTEEEVPVEEEPKD